MSKSSTLSNSSKSKKENRIKRFKSSYILFTIERRKILKEVSPNLSNPELTKLIAKEWKNMTPEEKNPYIKKEEIEKAKFLEMKKFDTFNYTKSCKLKKPIRFRTAYMFFMMDHKELLNSKEINLNIQRIKSLSTQWNNMSTKEKNVYIEKAKYDKKRYESDWEEHMKEYFCNSKDSKKKKNKKMKIIIKNLEKYKVDERWRKKFNEKLENGNYGNFSGRINKPNTQICNEEVDNKDSSYVFNSCLGDESGSLIKSEINAAVDQFPSVSEINSNNGNTSSNSSSHSKSNSNNGKRDIFKVIKKSDENNRASRINCNSNKLVCNDDGNGENSDSEMYYPDKSTLKELSMFYKI